MKHESQNTFMCNEAHKGLNIYYHLTEKRPSPIYLARGETHEYHEVHLYISFPQTKNHST